jgi:hypothetical protein
MVGQAVSLSNADSSDSQQKRVPHPLLFLRSTWGAILVGVFVALLIALPLLVLLPERQQTAQVGDEAEQELKNTFAGNSDFLGIPADRNAAPRQPQLPAANVQEAQPLNDPDPPRAENEAPIEPKDSETPPIRGEARLITGFDSSYPRKVARVGENHFTIDMKGPENNFFLFKLEGAAGKKIRVDLINLPSGYAPSLNPVYSYVKRLDDLECLASEKLENPRPLRKAKNGSPIPDTNGQKWHYIENVSYGMTGGGGNLLRGNLLGGRRAVLGGGVMSFEGTFEQDAVFISMRFPYTYGYNEAFLKQLVQDHPWVKVYNVGKSKEGRNLQIVQIGEGLDREGKQKPTVVIYAREHGNEHDTSHAAEVAIRFLVSNDLVSVKARINFCFIVIPMVDPDGATAGKYANATESFFFGDKIPEALGYSAFFKSWVDSGKRLDVILNLHNVRSYGSPHLFCPEIEQKRLGEFRTFNQHVTNELKGFDVHKDPSQFGYQRFRIGGWLMDYFGAFCVPYEINSQAPSRHLAIWELHETGACLARAALKYLNSADGKTSMEKTTATLKERAERFRKYGRPTDSVNALVTEWRCREGAIIEIQRLERAEK